MKVLGHKVEDPDVWPDEQPVSRGRKNRRRWCRGKVGVDHVWQERIWRGFPFVVGGKRYYVEVCENCGRHGKMRWGPEGVDGRPSRLS